MWLKIKVLLWKKLQLQKKRWLSTILGITVPCLFFYAMLRIISLDTTNVDAKVKDQTIPAPISYKTLLIKFKNQYSSGNLVFTPKTYDTEKIINNFIKKSGIPSSKIYVVDNENEMIKKFEEKLNRSDVKNSHKIFGFGVVFEEIVKSRVFKYKIRSTFDEYYTNLLFPLKETQGPMKSDEAYIKRGFLALQFLLDYSFIYMDNFDNSNTNMTDYNLKLQSYPYKKFKEVKNSFVANFPIFIVIIFLVMYLQTIKLVVEEKYSGIKELMKMMGLKFWMMLIGWILYILIVQVISITFITYMSCFGTRKIFNYTNPFLLWIFFEMYLVSGILFCFAIVGLFYQPLFALSVSLITWIFSLTIPNSFLNDSTSNIIKTISMLLPNVCLIRFVDIVSSLEAQKIGLQFSSILTTTNIDNNCSVGFILFMFIIDGFIYGFIAWYLDSVMPGKYGVAKPLHFLCIPDRIKPKANVFAPTVTKNNTFFEKPNNFEVGISVKNLHKQFGKLHAVNGVTLDLYKGQITALLGHNSAGKTTTMSIITGLFSPTSGSVEVNGNDLFSNVDQFRKNLGLCPQHNLLFSYLTAIDHLIFFGMLKGLTLKEAQSDGMNLLKLLNIFHKKDEFVDNLSGGMKRKMSLAIALIGDPEVLILDEPTSGMDPESRREMWDLLLSFRGTRTILITTHVMEEADVLGDRIAIMSHGQVKCYGTSLFLKKAYGTGYNLTIVKDESCDESTMIEEIKILIPEAIVQRSLNSQLVINLPNKNTDQFSNVFRMLENNTTEFCIRGMGISCTTMEEVFLRAEENIHDDNNGDELRLPPNRDDTHSEVFTQKYSSGTVLLVNQLKVLLEKKILYTCRRWLLTLTFGVISILSGMIIVTPMDGLLNGEGSSKLHVSLKTYKDISVRYRSGDNSSENLEPTFVAISKAIQATVSEISSKNYIINDLLDMCRTDEFKYRKNLMIAGDFNKTNATVIYNNIAIHMSAIALNLYSNAVLQKSTGNSNSYISTTNEPIQSIKMKKLCINSQTNSDIILFISILWLMFFTPSILFLMGHFMALPLNERVSGIKYLQIMTNLSPITYWITCFLWDYFCYIIIVLLTMLAMYLFDEYHIFTGQYELRVLLTLFLIFGWSAIFYVYVFSFFNTTLTSSMLIFLSINYISGIVINILMMAFEELIMEENIISPFNFWNIVRCIILLNPYFSYSSCVFGFLHTSWKNKHCEICKSFYLTKKCSVGSKQSYFVFKSNKNAHGILEETLFLLFSSLLYIAIILFFDYKIFTRVYKFFFNKIVGTDVVYQRDQEDSDIGAERNKVNAAKSLPRDESSPLLLVDNLVKKFNFKFTAVRGISFTVSPGECFGLLGVNGAGKTTTFRMLTGDLFPSEGDAYIQMDKSYKLSSDENTYVSMIGYCPQFDAINDHLTGKETLKLMAVLRGIPSSDTKKHVDKWITSLGLEEWKDRLSGNYSGGNKRKLNTAMALIGDPPLIFLDEPTSGVDPVSRRNLWNLLADCQRNGQSVILTSHSMDECETLCHRLTIMVDGVMKCIGKIQYLKNRYGQGFTIMVKLHSGEDIDIDTLKNSITDIFSPDIVLKDEHKGLLHYHITDPKVPLSKIFNLMEEVKSMHPEIEDYTVSDTTLEQVFLAFAKRRAFLSTNAD